MIISSLSSNTGMSEHVNLDVADEATVSLEKLSKTKVLYSVIFNGDCSVLDLESILDKICNHLKYNSSPTTPHKIGTKIVVNKGDEFPTHIEYRSPEKISGKDILHRLSSILQSNAILHVSKIMICFTYFICKSKKKLNV